MPDTERIRHADLDDGRITGITRGKTDSGEPFTEVSFESRPEAGSLIRNAVWLPDEWNGVFIGTGNGGMAGALSRNDGLIGKGFAVAHSDLGTSRGVASGVGNPAVWRDFGWRATHLMTAGAKSLIKKAYGAEASLSYFLGTSTGGEQAIMEAERFPNDYDGILAGKPANNRIALHTYFLWNHNHLRTRNGKKLFAEKDVFAVSRAAARFFAAYGGEREDRFVTLPYCGEDTEERFIAFLEKDLMLEKEQTAALRAVYRGPVNPRTGERIYNGMPIGSERYSCGIMDCMTEQSPYFFPFQWAFGTAYDGYDFDFDRDLDELVSLLGADMSAGKADLSCFISQGGKMIIYSGASDPCVPYPDAMAYYERAVKKAGGYEAIGDSVRYFLAPGMDHGESGLGAKRITGVSGEDLLTVLRSWREKSLAPDRMLAVMDTEGKTARPLAPYGSAAYPFAAHVPTASEKYQGE